MARERYRARAAQRHAGHLDAARTDDELWRSGFQPLGIGPLLRMDTTVRVDVADLARRIRASVD